MNGPDGQWIGYGLGDTGPEVTKIQHRLIFAYPKNSQAVNLGVAESGVFDGPTKAAVINIAIYINATQGKLLRTDGIADYAIRVAIGAYVPPPQNPTKRFVQQGVGYDTSAFFMGNTDHSYVDAMIEAPTEFLRLALPEPRPKVLYGYSMGADAVVRSLMQWPADRRSEIRLVCNFGSPGRPPGPTLLGNNEAGSGISGLFTPDWARPITFDFTQSGDMYPNSVGVMPDMYQILTRMETTTEFAVYLFNLFATATGKVLLGQVLSEVPGAGILAPLLDLILGKTGQVDLLKMITNIPGIVTALLGLVNFIHTDAHYHYHDTPRPFWRGLTAVDCAAQITTERVKAAVVYTFPGTVSWWNDGPPAWAAWKLP